VKRTRLALFRRLPRVRWRQPPIEDIVPASVLAEYPGLAEEFEILTRELLPDFHQLNAQALHAQNRFWRGELALIAGGALATALGVVAAATDSMLPGAVEAVLAAFLAAIARSLGDSDVHRQYFTSRLRAEHLRSEYFRFVSRVGDYADDRDRVRALRRRVAEIVTETSQ
jgi:uncharacterized protein DUF4231